MKKAFDWSSNKRKLSGMWFCWEKFHNSCIHVMEINDNAHERFFRALAIRDHSRISQIFALKCHQPFHKFFCCYVSPLSAPSHLKRQSRLWSLRRQLRSRLMKITFSFCRKHWSVISPQGKLRRCRKNCNPTFRSHKLQSNKKRKFPRFWLRLEIFVPFQATDLLISVIFSVRAS